jgi:hypothetical protein
VTPTYDCYEDDEVSSFKMPDIDDIKEENDVYTYDQYVGTHVRVPIGDEIRSSPAKARYGWYCEGVSQCQLNVGHQDL